MVHSPSSKLFVTTHGRVITWRYNARGGCCQSESGANIRIFDVNSLAHVQMAHSHNPLSCLEGILGATCIPIRARHSSALLLTFGRFPRSPSFVNDLMGLPRIVSTSAAAHVGMVTQLFDEAAPYSGSSVFARLGPAYVAIRAVLGSIWWLASTAFGVARAACGCSFGSFGDRVDSTTTAALAAPPPQRDRSLSNIYLSQSSLRSFALDN